LLSVLNPTDQLFADLPLQRSWVEKSPRGNGEGFAQSTLVLTVSVIPPLLCAYVSFMK